MTRTIIDLQEVANRVLAATEEDVCRDPDAAGLTPQEARDMFETIDLDRELVRKWSEGAYILALGVFELSDEAEHAFAVSAFLEHHRLLVREWRRQHPMQ